MSLFGRKEKQEIERLRAQLSPEQLALSNLTAEVEKVQKQLTDLQKEVRKAQTELATAKQELIETDEAVLLQSFGFYVPHYSYALSDDYKSHLKIIRDRQKESIKAGLAVKGNENWKVNESAAKGRKWCMIRRSCCFEPLILNATMPLSMSVSIT